MASEHLVTADLANVFQEAGGEYATTLGWGDEVELLGKNARGHLRVRVPVVEQGGISRPTEIVDGIIKTTRDILVRKEEWLDKRVLKVNFIDVQQGDAAVIETPGGKVMLVDGGETKLLARYLASRYRDTSLDAPKEIACIVISHGDADHYLGLPQIQASETHAEPWKRIFMQPRCVYHNGLVKRPSNRAETEQFGRTTQAADDLIITELTDDPRQLPDAEMNDGFKQWKHVLERYAARKEVQVQRLSRGDRAFEFLADEPIGLEVLGPVLTTAGGATGLKFLREPPKRGIRGTTNSRPPKPGGLSASHTINGHSIVLRLTYGGFRFLFAGDLNEEAENVMTDGENAKQVRAEVLKVPHHGSADFSPRFLKAVGPVVSVVSSGDENARKEYIHPRSTLMGALGRYSRAEVEEPLVFVTELVAFFQTEGYVLPNPDRSPHPASDFFAFSRPTYGAVRVRTNGERLLVYTYTGKQNLQEAYAFVVEDDQIKENDVRRIG